MRLGTYTDGAPGQNGTWTPWDGPEGNASHCIDGGAFYASKDMHDTARDRRIICARALIKPAAWREAPSVARRA